MPNAIDFPESNTTYKRPPPMTEEECFDLHTWKSPTTVVSCWKLTPEELERIAETGVVWLSVMAPNNLPPCCVMIDKPCMIQVPTACQRCGRDTSDTGNAYCPVCIESMKKARDILEASGLDPDAKENAAHFMNIIDSLAHPAYWETVKAINPEARSVCLSCKLLVSIRTMPTPDLCEACHG